MKKFDALLNETYRNILLREAPPGAQPPPPIPQDGGPMAGGQLPPVPGQGQPPAPPPPPAEPEPITSEGKAFLVDLALKALAVDPSSISEFDRAIFNTKVTPQNADEVLKKIQTLVEGL